MTMFDFGNFVSSLKMLENGLEVSTFEMCGPLMADALLRIKIPRARGHEMGVVLRIKPEMNMIALNSDFNLSKYLGLTDDDEGELNGLITVVGAATIDHSSKMFVWKMQPTGFVLRVACTMFLPTALFLETEALQNIARFSIPKLVDESTCTLEAFKHTWKQMNVQRAEQTPALLN
jgi:hypothetical protein